MYVISAMLVSSMVFAYIMGSIASFVQAGDEKIRSMEDQVNRINKFMVANKMPRNFRHRVKRYFDYIINYKKQFKLDEDEVLGMLSENLRFDLTVHIRGNVLKETKTF